MAESTISVATARSIHLTEEQAPFPFMKLPAELRVMVYKYHFFQSAQHLAGHCEFAHERACGSGGPACGLGIVNEYMHLGNIWITSKAIYCEAMPIYFGTHDFHFSCIGNLFKFLTNIPYYHRQHITKLSFVHTNGGRIPKTARIDNFDIHQAFRLLSDCPNLIELGICLSGFEAHRIFQSQWGLKTLLKLRGIETLRLEEVDGWADPRVPSLGRSLSVLKGPYSPAEEKRRQARGIVKDITLLRTCFDGSETDTRTARYERRGQLKEVA
ncbi:MAG: hypothetical protein LQ337_007532 [Flavoplaca oasis]|nr:MAG: hypothetical protein LQ337_007532 [Flavoplaca oasis]